MRREGYEKNDYLVGTLFSGISYHIFLDSILYITDDYTIDVSEISHEYIDKHKMSNSRFPEWLTLLMGPVKSTLEWHDPIYEETAIEFAFLMSVGEMDKETIDLRILFWHFYSTTEKPIIKKINMYLATLEYFTMNILGDDYYVP